MTRKELEGIKQSEAYEFNALVRDLCDALDELIPREFKVGDVVVRVTVMVIGRIVDFNDGIVDVKSGQGSTRFHLRDAEIRHATPEEIAVFEAWEKGK